MPFARVVAPAPYFRRYALGHEENMEFQYSRFYVIQPVCAFVWVGLFLTFIIYETLLAWPERNQIVAWFLIICFLLYVMVRVILHFIKVMKDPVLFRLGEESISAVYREGRVDQIFWRDIKSIHSHRDPWRIGLETIEITFKDGSERTLCNNFVKKYKAFKLAISDTASTKVALVKLTDNGKGRTIRRKA